MGRSRSMKILHVDTNHPLLWEQLEDAGCINEADYASTKEEVMQKIEEYDGLVIRSRFPIDRYFLEKANKLAFIARVGSGLENIDQGCAKELGIQLLNAPEGNNNAVGEHCLGMLLSLLNKLKKADREVRQGQWSREANRGVELDGQTVGLIGYGNMGKAFAKKLNGFEVTILCYDIVPNVGDEHVTQVTLKELQKEASVVSLHTPETPLTIEMVNKDFIDGFAKPFWFLNTARGKSVVTEDLVNALRSGKVLGAGLDVLEYEKRSFENLFEQQTLPEAFQYLTKAENVLLSPHVAGWTVESKEKLAQIIADKIKRFLLKN